MNAIIRAEFAGALCGVAGRFYDVVADTESGLIRNQRFTTYKRDAGDGFTVAAFVRFDDSCGNGHATFSVTGEMRGPAGAYCGGCVHDDIAQHFPELRHLLPWHLCASDGPLHYVANTIYHAGDRDHYKRRAGEVSRSRDAIRFGDNPVAHYMPRGFVEFLRSAAEHNGRDRFDFEIIRLDHKPEPDGRRLYSPKFTFGGFGAAWHEGPFDTESDAVDFLIALREHAPAFVKIPVEWSDGKPRDLAAARNAAIWPDASDAELTVEPDALRAALESRLPPLLHRFRSDVETAGLLWSPQPVAAVAETQGV